MSVLVLHSKPPDAPGAGRLSDEFNLSEAAANVAAVFPDCITRAVRGEVKEVLELLDVHRPDVVFNLCEAPLGRPDLESHLAALLEWLGVRFTGCGSQTLALCRRKDLVDAVMRDAAVPAPATVDPMRPVFPCIVKPAAEDGSAGMDHDSVCEDAGALARALARLEGQAIVQEFLTGREFAVALWGRSRPDYVSIGENILQQGLRLITYSAKWHVDSPDFANSPISYTSEIAPPLRQSILAAARSAWDAVGARHALRVDVRLDGLGNPRVLDVNPNPEMGPGVGICRAVQEAGWPWRDFVHKLVEWA